MARGQQQTSAKEEASDLITEGLFAGVDAKRAAVIEAHYADQLAAERANLNALLDEATKSPPSESVGPREITPENIVAALAHIQGFAGECAVVLAAKSKSASQVFDHKNTADYARLTTVFGEFRNTIATFLARQGKP